VSSTVTILVEIAGGNDFEVSGLATDNGFTPVIAYGPSDEGDKCLGYTPLGVHGKSNVYKEDHLLLEAQAPGTQVMQRGNAGRISSVHDDINPLGSPDDQGTSCLYTIGECITSFRQILKRSCLLASTTFNSAARDRVFKFNPFAVYLPVYVNGANPAVLYTSGAQYCDWYSWITPCYALRRGAVNTKVYNAASNADCSVVSFISYTGTTSTLMGNDATATRNQINLTNNTVISSSTVQGVLETHIPFYSASHSMPVTTSIANLTIDTVEPFFFANCPEQRVIATTSVATNYIVLNTMRQVADDFDLGLFLTTMPIRAVGATNAVYSI